MGMCGSSLTDAERAEIIDSNRIDQDQMKTKLNDNRMIKILLLGTGESGKSTIFKQMQLLYASGFSYAAREIFRQVIRKNVVESFQNLIHAVYHFGWTFESPEEVQAAEVILRMDPLATDFWVEELVKAVEILWNPSMKQNYEIASRLLSKRPTLHKSTNVLPAISQQFKGSSCIQRAIQNRYVLQVSDSAIYFFNKISTLAEPNYLPSDDDILRARLRTTGIVESIFTIDKVPFKFIDVGGQRNERRKWIHCFDAVTAVLFVAAINEYDQVLYEDSTQNRLCETISVFREICNNPFLKDTAMILFLNKRDLFIEKIPYSDPGVFFSEYKGGRDAERAMQFIKNQFLSQSKDLDKDIFCHFTVATDTENVERVWNDCREIILKRNLEMSGLGLM